MDVPPPVVLPESSAMADAASWRLSPIQRQKTAEQVVAQDEKSLLGHNVHLLDVARLGESYGADARIYARVWGRLLLVCGPYVGAGLFLGLSSLAFYSTTDPARRPRGTHGWPEVAAVPLAVSVLGSALSFLLVFRLSWAFGRWADARGLLGAMAARLRALCVLGHAQLDLSGGAPRQEQQRCLDELIEVADQFFHAVVLSLERGPRHALRAKPTNVGATAHEQVLGTHQWLARLLARAAALGLVPAAAERRAYDDLAELLREYFSTLKIKTTQMPILLQCLVAVLKMSFTVVIFPQAMAYAFVMKLSSDEAARELVWRNAAYYVTMYALITSLTIVFFTTLHYIAKELDDPFGDDISDLPLKEMRRSLVDDMLAVRRAAFPVHDIHAATLRAGAEPRRGAARRVPRVGSARTPVAAGDDRGAAPAAPAAAAAPGVAAGDVHVALDSDSAYFDSLVQEHLGGELDSGSERE